MPSVHTTRESCLTGLVHREFATDDNYHKLKSGASWCNHKEAVDGSDKYQLINRIAGHDIVAFGGLRNIDGKRVLLHQLAAPSDHTGVLTMALKYMLRHSGGGNILDLVEIADAHYIVTDDVPDCLALKEWLSWELSESHSALAKLPAREPGEFSQLFRKAAPPANATADAWAASSPREPGEFTRQFRDAEHTRANNPPPPAASRPPVQPLHPGVEERQPGEFTRLFHSPLAQPSASPREPIPLGSPSEQGPGEFTRIFGIQTPHDAAPLVPAPTPPAPLPARPPFPGALTESLEPRWAAAPAPAVPVVGAGPGEFTRVIRPAASTPAMVPAVPQPAASVPVVTVSATPPAVPAMPVATAPTMPSVASPAIPTIQIPSVAMGSAPSPVAGGAQGLAQPTSPGRRLLLTILFAVLLIAALVLIALVVFRS